MPQKTPEIIDVGKALFEPQETIKPVESKPEPKPLVLNEDTAKGFFAVFNEGLERAEAGAKKAKAEKEKEPKKEADKTDPAEPSQDKPAKIATDKAKETDKDDPDKADPAEADKPKGVKVSKRQQPTMDEVADIAIKAGRAQGEEIARAVAKSMKRDEPKAPDKVEPKPPTGLTGKQQEKLEVFREMASASPDRYAKLPDEFVSGLRNADIYRQKWQQENPGKRFNPNDQEHEDAFSSLEPDFDEDDYVNAVVTIKTRPIDKSVKEVEALKEKLKAIEEKEAERAIEPIVRRAQTEAAGLTVSEIDPKMLEGVKSQEDFDAARKRDPIAFDITMKYASRSGAMAAVVSRMLDPDKPSKIDFKSDEVREVMDLKSRIEREIKALPLREQIDNGRRFVTWDEYGALLAADPDAAGNDVWFLDSSTLRRAIAVKMAGLAKQEIAKEVDRATQYAESLGWRKSDHVPDATQKPPAKDVEKLAPKQPDSPSAIAGKAQASNSPDPQHKAPDGWKEKLIGIF